MPDSIIPFIVVPAAIAVFYYLTVLQPKWEKAAKEKEQRIMARGQEVMAYVQMANTQLYQPNTDGGHSYAQVVYVTDPDVPDLEGELKGIAARLTGFEVADAGDETERRIGSVLSSQVPYFTPLRLPPRVAGAHTAFTVSLRVAWNKLRDGKLTAPLVRIRVLDGEEDGVRMVPEPGSKDRPGQ